MANHDSDAWRPHPPQHAASTGWIAAVMRNAHRVLRLFVQTGTWGAGICLLVGVLVLLATVIGASHAAPRGSDRQTASPPGKQAVSSGHDALGPDGAAIPAPQPATAPPASGHAAAEPSVHGRPRTSSRLAVAGHGNLTTRAFSIAAHSWQLRWSYACRAWRRGDFFSFRVVTESEHGSLPGPEVVQTGPAGHGVSVHEPDAAPHYLVVMSTCAWTVQVTSG